MSMVMSAPIENILYELHAHIAMTNPQRKILLDNIEKFEAAIRTNEKQKADREVREASEKARIDECSTIANLVGGHPFATPEEERLRYRIADEISHRNATRNVPRGPAISGMERAQRAVETPDIEKLERAIKLNIERMKADRVANLAMTPQAPPPGSIEEWKASQKKDARNLLSTLEAIINNL